MNKSIILIILLIASLSLRATDITTVKLANGMQIAVRPTDSSSVALFCFVKTGAIHQEEYIGTGISHYLEHIISGGSTTFHNEEEYQRLEAELGIDSNAFTSYDMTAYHMVIGSEYAEIGIEILAQQIFHCTFDPAEVEREKQVILKEILMGETPHDLAYQGFYEVAYSDTHYRYPLIGYAHLFETLTRDDLITYYKRRYTPHNMVFVAVGGFDPEDMIQNITAIFEPIHLPPTPEVFLPVQRVPTYMMITQRQYDIDQPFVYLNRPLPLNKPQDYVALVMASNILFGKRSSPITYYMEEELQLVYYIYSYAEWIPYSHTANLVTTFELPFAEDSEIVIEMLTEELKLYTKAGKIKQNMLTDVIKRMEAELILSEKSLEEEAEEIGTSLIYYNIPNSREQLINELKKVTISDVQRVIKEYYLAPQVVYQVRSKK